MSVSESPDVKRFLNNPNEETFAKVTQLSSALIQILEKNPELAKKHFKFVDWLALEYNCLLTIDEKTKQLIRDQLKASISSFDDAYRYYFTLCPTAKKLYVTQLIDFCETEEDLEKLNKIVKKDFSEAIERMRKKIHSS